MQNYAAAEVVAGYARQRAQRQIVDEDGTIHPLRFNERKTEKLSTPLRRYAPRPACLRGTVSYYWVTLSPTFLP